MTAPASCIYLGTAVVFASAGALQDVRTRRIPNRLNGAGVLAGLLLHLVLGGFTQLVWACSAGLVAGGIFLFFYLAGGMGAGDVKLMTAVGCISGIASVKDVLLATVFVGAILALVLAAVKGRLRETLGNVGALLAHHQRVGLAAHPELNVANHALLRLPYAVPIACGCLIALGMEIARGARL